MPLETGDYISDLNQTNPIGATDTKAQGDDHIRLLKKTIKQSFPNVAGAVIATHTQLNAMSSTMGGGAAHPTGNTGLTATNGVANTVMRSDASPALSQNIAPTWTGPHKFSNTVAIELEATAPLLLFDETDAPSNERSWLWRSVAGDFVISTATDAAPTTPVNPALTITRNGTAIDGLTTNAPFTFQSTSTVPANIVLFNGTAPSDEKNSIIRQSAAGPFAVSFSTDAAPGTPVTNPIVIDRTGTTVDSIIFSATDLTYNNRLTGSGVADFNTTLGAGLNLSSALPAIFLNETDGATNNKRWAIYASAENFNLAAVNDSNGSGVDFLRCERTAAAVDQVTVTTPLLQVAGIHNGTAPSGTNNYIASGTYTPTVTNIANVGSSTPRVSQWMRVGNVVTVSGSINIDASLNNTTTSFRITLPIASNLASAGQLGGTAGRLVTTAESVAISADTTNDAARFDFYVQDATAGEFTFIFQYVVV